MADRILSSARRAIRWLAATPVHPQWLLYRTGPSVASLNVHPGDVVLDVGCGNRWLQRALPDGVTYLGLDHPDPGGRYPARPDLYADAAHLPLRDSSVDAVALIEVLEHVREPSRVVREASRVLKRGGRLVLTMPFLYPVHDAPHDFQRFTRFGLQRELENAGFRVERLEPALGPCESAGLLVCLALSGSAATGLSQRSPRTLFALAALPMVPIINLFAWAAGRLLPHWSGLCSGHHVVAAKP